MSGTLEGGCRCGAVRYAVKADKLPNAYACHCLDCQTWSGSAFSLQFIVPENALTITGAPHLYERTTGEGSEQRTSHQRGCAQCMTRVYNTNTRRPGLAVVRAGTLDRSNDLTIVAHIWTKRKLSGIDMPAGTPTWPEGAPPADFMAVLMK
ncbi:MAG: GFA family protein [Alphaproteobacteria bacterium]|nr:GFA family protein [Alphaproteobacteria bacterium]